ncbi:MAG: DUF533 domain-containing protein [Vicinamibacterales bacterium]
MFNTDDLVRGVLAGVLGGRRKRSKNALKYLTGRGGGLFSNPATLLTVAGVAWGIVETLQHSGGPGGQSASNAPSVPPLPNVVPDAPGAPGAPGAPDAPGAPSAPDTLRMIRLAIAAAAADGTLTDEDRARIAEHARAAGADHLMERELQNRRPVAEIVAGITDPAERARLYVLAFSIIRADESVSGAERIFLAQLAVQLGLDPAAVSKLEADTAARIDAQS